MLILVVVKGVWQLRGNNLHVNENDRSVLDGSQLLSAPGDSDDEGSDVDLMSQRSSKSESLQWRCCVRI